jgi:3-phenylpropionate/trans-cinnamate dioxygenase ferredoxin subunit
VTTVAEVPPGTARVFPVGDREIAVCNVDGEFYAIDNVCSHDEGPLDQGEVIGCEIECPRHGARFDVRNGKVTAPPAFLPVDVFPVRVEGDAVEVDV